MNQQHRTVKREEVRVGMGKLETYFHRLPRVLWTDCVGGALEDGKETNPTKVGRV